MKYYNCKDIIDLTGLGKTATYELIKKLNEKLKREYPGTVTLDGKVPKWYFDEKMMIEKIERRN